MSGREGRVIERDEWYSEWWRGRSGREGRVV